MEEKRVLFRHIKQLFPVLDQEISRVEGKNMRELQVLENAWLEIRNGVIHDFGSMKDCPVPSGNIKVVEAHGRLLMPAFCDSHTHIVYAGSREKEYVDKIRGLSYEEIARRGGGILNSALLLRIRESVPMTVKSTFLGAHSIPMEYRGDPDKYVDLVVREMIPAVGREKLADHIDVFCDRGFFTPEQTARILEAGARYGMVPKIHANELDYSGGIQTGVKYGAFSVDHLEYTGEEEIRTLLKSRTMPTLLPGASFFLGMPYAPAREMIDAGLPVALASDYNPGSSPSGNMKLIMSLGCIQMKMLPEEAIYAVTINGACAMGVEKETGSITRGKKANLILTIPVPGYEFLSYAYGSNLVESVWLNGLKI